MKALHFAKTGRQAAAWVALLTLGSALAIGQGQVRSDSQIEMDVVHDLDGAAALKDDLITAATIDSQVTLSGTVASESSRELAETIAARVAGVTKVNNHLSIGNPQQAESNPAPVVENQPADSEPVYANSPEPGNAPAYAPADEGPQTAPPPQYAHRRPVPPAYEMAKGPVTVPPGTLVELRTSEAVGSKMAREGTMIQFVVLHDVAVGGVLAIPRGATVHGVISDITQAGTVKGSNELALTLTSLDLGGQNYPLASDQFKVRGPGKGGRTAASAFAGALFGAIVGGAADGGAGAAIGAGAGAVAGGATSAAIPAGQAWIPAEALVTFHLTQPLTVNPVSAREAERLAQGLYPGGPVLYQRDVPPPPYGQPYYVVGRPYPPVYYRPYTVVDGYYVWR